MDFFGAILGNVPYLGHLVACCLSFYGMYYTLSRINLSTRKLLFALLFLSLPTFSIWTNIFGKECVIVFALGLVFGYLIELKENKNLRPKCIQLVGFYLVLVFKPHYLIAILELISIIWIWRNIQSKILKFIFMVLMVIFNLSILYLTKDIVDELSWVIISHFSLDGASTRDASFIWTDKYDFFRHAFQGMYIAFIGPTFSEALSKPIQMFVFFESMVILNVFLYLFSKQLIFDLSRSKINLFFMAVILNTFFWMLFVHYPFGVLNPGSAVRYRSGFVHFLFFLLLYFTQIRKMYLIKPIG